MHNIRPAFFAVIALIAISSCNHPSATPPMPVDTSAHSDTTHHTDTTHRMPTIDTTHRYFVRVSVSGIILQDTVSYPNTHDPGHIQTDSLDFGDLSYFLGALEMRQRHDSLYFAAGDPSISFLFIIDSSHQEFTFIHVDDDRFWHFDMGAGESREWKYDLTDIPFTVDSDGSIHASILLTDRSSHLLNYDFQYWSWSDHSAGDVTFLADTRLMKIFGVSKNAHIDILIRPE